jgi:hypothetical protein
VTVLSDSDLHVLPARVLSCLCAAQDKLRNALQALYQNRRLVAVGVAILDVAFLWVAVKLGKQWFWDPNH